MPVESRRDRVIREIRSRIASGEWAAGAALPTHRALAEQFGVGMTTIRSAVMILKATGELIGEQGVGVYVAGDQRER